MKNKYKSVTLAHLCDIKTGRKDVNQGNPSGEFPFFTCAREHTYSDEYSFDGEAILIAGNGDVGNTNYYNGKFEAYQRTYVLMNFKHVDTRYLYHLISGTIKPLLHSQKLGNTMPYIKKGMLTDFDVPLPPIEEQKRIVAILDDAFERIDTAIANTEKNLANARKLFQSNLQRLFLELADTKCPVNKLGQITEVSSGGTPLVSRKEFWGGDIPWYSSGELNDMFTKDPERSITSAALDNSNAKLFPKGSLLIGMYDTAALKMSILDRDAAFNQAISGVKPNDCLDMKFALYAITVNKPALLRERRGVRQKNLSLKKIKDILMPLPMISVQKRIAKQQNELEKKAIEIDTICRAKCSLLTELKQSLLQKAFSGELTTDFNPDALEH